MSALTANVAIVSDSPNLSFNDVAPVAAAMQKQVTRDFSPLWNVQATVSAFDKLENVPVDYWPVILRDDINAPGAAGFHTDKNGQPFSLVQIDSGWNLTVSHETLEMLADPFGNRTVAGAPPKQAKFPKNVHLKRVLYLVEVCDPCEADQFAYTSNGVHVSDFITPQYYDPSQTVAARYSFGGNIQSPHQVLDGGYVSFGDPKTNHWYQVLVENGKAVTKSLGIIQTNGRSLRETIDDLSRKSHDNNRFQARTAKTMKAAAGAAANGGTYAESSAARAKELRQKIDSLFKP